MKRAPRSDPPPRSDSNAKPEQSLEAMAADYWRLWQRNLRPPLPREQTTATATPRKQGTNRGA